MHRPGIVPHTHKDAEAEKFHKQVRASVGHEWNGGPSDWQKTDVHAGVNHDVAHKNDAEAKAK